MSEETASVKAAAGPELAMLLGDPDAALFGGVWRAGATAMYAALCAAEERLAVDETVVLLHPPSTFSRCINSDGERASAK